MEIYEWISLVLTVLSLIVSAISLAYGIITFQRTGRIDSQLKLHIEGKDFLENVSESIQNLQSYHDTITQDNIYNNKILLQVRETIDDLLINYSLVLSTNPDISSEMKRLNDDLYKKCTLQMKTGLYKDDYVHTLNKIITRLKKLKKERENL